MMNIRSPLGCLVILAALVCPAAGQTFSGPLTWDATSKFYSAKRGETNTVFLFNLTNVSHWNGAEVNGVSTTCGCTIVKMPPAPWLLPPGASGKLEVHVDLRGKQGLLTKMMRVVTSGGAFDLAVNVDVPGPDAQEQRRMVGLQVAQLNRQFVLKGECAKCHVQPAIGKKGAELYHAACAICHEAEHRAQMVPDLAALKTPTDRSYWEQWVRNGKPGTLMPAFSKASEGPLEEEQISSLVEYLNGHFRPAQAGSAVEIPPAKAIAVP